MKAALVQLNPTTGDIRGNAARIRERLQEAKAAGCGLAVFPEMAITGYCVSDLIEDRSFLEANRAALESLAPLADTLDAVVGFVDFDPNRRNEDGRILKRNAAAVLSGGRIAGVAAKTLLPNYRYFDDKRYFTPADRREPIRDLGVSICEDMWDELYALKPLPELASRGARLLININASPFTPAKRAVREEIVRRHVAATGLPFLYVNTVGASDNGKNIIPFDGQSMAHDASGRLIGLGRPFREEVVIVDLDRPEPAEPPAVSREAELFDALVMSLRDYARKVGFSRAVVPVSGGIDSALGLAITVEAMGAAHVAAFNLPSKFNSPTTRSIAERVSSNFGVRYTVVPIQEIDDVVRRTFEGHAHPVRTGTARENVHARIRGLLMMLESNDTGALLISNGNETEIALGYSTLYGDMCGGVSVIGDLSKTDVYAVARHVNARHGREMIPKETFEIAPSAELRENQIDPFDYAIVSPMVTEYSERRRGPEEVARMFEERRLDGFPTEVYTKHTAESFRALAHDMYRLFRNSVYKRLQGPPIIVVSERAFGFDLREPIINRWEGR
jgi:NAD+ synthase (glutamine-hydrolysing)